VEQPKKGGQCQKRPRMAQATRVKLGGVPAGRRRAHPEQALSFEFSLPFFFHKWLPKYRWFPNATKTAVEAGRAEHKAPKSRRSAADHRLDSERCHLK